MALSAKTKKISRRILWIAGTLFILMNMVAYFHAYKFTHFSLADKNKTKDPKKLGWSQKINTLIFGINNPRPENNSTPDSPYETIKLRSNKIIECWLIRSREHKGTVILFHGYAANKSSLLDEANIFLKLGYNTLLVDFMGSGGSEGIQTTIGTWEAQEVKTAADFIDSTGERNIILFGTSMGAVAIMRAESQFKLHARGLILECPFGTLLTTVQARFRNMRVPGFPMANLLVFWGGAENDFNGFTHKPVEYAKSISCPTLLIYGELDDKVSRKEIDEIYLNLAGPKKLITYPLAGHEDYLLKYGDAWKSGVSAFLNGINTK